MILTPIACLVALSALRFKYTPSGHVKVSLSTALTLARNGRIAVELSILDTGKGMSEDFLRRFCFQPFAQEDPITPGTGLGLAITSNLVRSLGGSISVTSVQGRGSEFTVSLSLPMATPSAPPRPPPAFAGRLAVAFIGYSLTDKTLQTQRRLLENMLGAWDVTLRGDGPESETDLLIVDESTPVEILLTYPNHRALWASADRQLAPTDSFVDVLLKPIGPVQLEEAISQLLSRDRTNEERASGAARLRVDVDPHSAAPSPVSQSPTDHELSNGLVGGTEQPSTAPDVQAEKPAASLPRILHVEDNGASTSSAANTSNCFADRVFHSDLSGVNRVSASLRFNVRAFFQPIAHPILFTPGSVLRAFFKKKGIPLDEAVDGAKGAEMFKRAPPGHYSSASRDRERRKSLC